MINIVYTLYARDTVSNTDMCMQYIVRDTWVCDTLPTESNSN